MGVHAHDFEAAPEPVGRYALPLVLRIRPGLWAAGVWGAATAARTAAMPPCSSSHLARSKCPLIAAISDGKVVYRDMPTIVDKRGRILSLARNGELSVIDADGVSTMFDEEDVPIMLRRAAKTVQLVKLLDRHYFGTLRRKLRWGSDHKDPSEGGPHTP